MGNLSLGFWAIAFFLLGSLINLADGSIHEYKDGKFTKFANAGYFFGGTEGVYASEFLDVHASSDTLPPLQGKSFIRFDDISFVRTKESASKQNSTQANAGLVEAILFEVKQRDRIGGSFFKTEGICCTSKLADDRSCNLGEVIISPDPNAPEWPQRIPTFFKMALSRLLLVISTGYGAVKPINGGTARKMLLLGVLCFVLAEVLGLAGHIGYISEKGLTLLMLLWAIVEVFFMQWIFKSLWNTLKKLKVKSNMTKLRFYWMFATALVFLMFVNLALIHVEMCFITSSGDWQVDWIIPASWHVLAYALLLLICLLWPPSDQPTRNLYLAEMEDEFEEKEDLLLAEAGMKANVEKDERKSLLDACILLFGNLPGER